jgi:transposase
MVLCVMLKIDARKRSTDVQQHNREQAIRLYLDGMSRQEIARIIAVHYTTVNDWIRRYKKGGIDALQIGTRGRRRGDGRILTAAQEQRLKEIVVGKSPEQMHLPFALWSSSAIRALILDQWRIELPQRTISAYMRRWGYTPQKAAKRAYERSDKATRQWLAETYPYLKKRAAWHGGEIFWGDETGITNQCQHVRGYAPRGQTPIVKTQAKRFRTNLISAVNNQGKLRFMIYQETMTAKVLIRFMKRLIKDAGRKVFLILDNLRVHHANIVKAWLEKNKDLIEVYYLPAYTPEMNPDEYLNGDLKQGIRASSPARTQKQLEKKILKHMRKLQALPKRVKSYFLHPAIQYAA